MNQASDSIPPLVHAPGKGSAAWRLASPILALALVAILIGQCVVGALLPQEGLMGLDEIAAWQTRHPAVAALARPMGGFHLFHSWPFLATILLLAVNTLACSLQRVLFRDAKPIKSASLGAFLAIHGSVILILAGAFVSAATSMEGLVVLTEGQAIIECPDNYVKIAAGPLRRAPRESFTIRLTRVRQEFAAGQHPVSLASDIEITRRNGSVWSNAVAVNQPAAHQGVSITQGETGFSPKLVVRSRDTGATVLDTFIGLKTSRTPAGREYRDVLPPAYLGELVYITFYPDFVAEGDSVRKTGDQVGNPLLVVATADADGHPATGHRITLGSEARVGDYLFRFDDLRRWSALKLARDPGYPIICVAFVFGIAALGLRYFPEMGDWLGRG